MGGPGEIQLSAIDESTAKHALKAALDEIDRIEIKYSRYRPDSLISRINAEAGRGGQPCDAETQGLLDFANELHRQSGGCFDLTSGVWRRAWDFSNPSATPPSPEQLQALASFVGWQHLSFTEGQVKLLRVGMELDMGGIGKEYAVDRAAVVLQGLGIRHALINLAGDVRAIGGKPDGSAWRVGIRHPDEADATMAEIEIHDGALTTSGDYERCLIHEGKRYGHLLDARSGWPVSYWRSVSVRAPSALLAGGLSTVAMLMQAQGLELLKDSGVDFLAVDAQGRLYTPAGDQALPARTASTPTKMA